MTNQKKALEFPCDFDFKIFGLNNDTFEKSAIAIVRETFPDLKETAVKTKVSNKDKYLSVTIRVRATSQDELDKVYQRLTDSEDVLMSL